MTNNSKANYYGVVGSYLGAFRGHSGWVGVKEFNRHPELKPKPLVRWQGPPNSAISKALKQPQY